MATLSTFVNERGFSSSDKTALDIADSAVGSFSVSG